MTAPAEMPTVEHKPYVDADNGMLTDSEEFESDKVAQLRIVWYGITACTLIVCLTILVAIWTT